jgi:FG-GAP-like repeat/Bacterial Ig-like domain (group 3)
MATTSRLVQAAKNSSRAFWTKVSNLVSSTRDSGADAAKKSVTVKGAKRPWPAGSARAVVLALSVLSAVAAQSQQPNTNTLTVSPSTGVQAGEVVTLTATVYNAGSTACGGCGPVQFLDSSVQPHLIGKATTNTSGQASIKVRFGSGTHSITAFHPTAVYASPSYDETGNQTSPATVLIVSAPATTYATSTTISASGAPGNYTLSATTLAEGLGKPTGTISFQDASNSSSVLGSGTFSARTGYFPTGTLSGANASDPTGMVIGDFNNDGFPDLAILNYGNGTISVYLNNGNGTFGSAITFNVPNNGASAIAAGDPSGSGNLGIMVATGSELLFFAGNGNGTFSLASTHSLNHFPSQVMFGCYPEYWDQIICSVSQSSQIVELYFIGANYAMTPLQGGDGDFYSVGGLTSNVVGAQFAQDGNQYIAYGDASSKVVVVLTNFTTGGTTSAVYPVGAPPIGMVTGDFNNDGYPDIAVVTQNDGLWILLNKANGTGAFGTPYSVGGALPNPGAIVTADFNSGGNLDLALQQSGANPILIMYGNGAGGFSAAPQTSVTTGFADNNGMIAVGDFNGDGLPDLIATPNTYNTNAFSIMLGEQSETATTSGLIAYGNGAQNADAVYTPGTADSWAESTSTTTALQGIYATFSQAPPTTLVVGTAPGTIKVQINANSTLLSSFTGSVQLTVVAPSGTSQVYTQSAVAGVATFSAVAAPTQGGPYQYIANLPAGNTASASVAGETVGTGVAAKLAFNPGAPNSSATYTAGNASVSAEDIYGNIVTGFTGTVTLSSSDSAATLTPSPYTFVAADSGTHTFTVTFKTGGTQSLTAASTGLTSAVESGITVTSSVATTTYLGISATPITAKTVETLTASVTSGSIPVALGTVNFYDSLATPTLLGSAQVNSSGVAFFRYRPSIGNHTLTATYVANTYYPTSTATHATQPVAVTANQNYTTATTMTPSGSVGSYSLSSILTLYGFPAPTGNVSFEDTSNGNAVLATATLGASVPGFVQKSTLPVGSDVSGIAYGDFNNDGVADLAVVNLSGGSVSIFLGVGDGTFTSAASVAVGNGPDAIATGDFNGDGNLDLAVVNQTDKTVTILKGNGSGGFTPFPGSPVAVGNGALAVTVGDFNGDGYLDLAVDNYADNTFSLLKGNGSGGFTALAGITTVFSDPSDVALTDLNGDGKLDLVWVDNSSFGVLAWALGNGDGTFGQENDLTAGASLNYLTLGDFNGDGKIDVAASSVSSGSVTVFLNNGSGGFTLTSTLAPPSPPYSLAAANFSGSGFLDLAVDMSGGGVLFYKGAGNGTFTAETAYGGAGGSGTSSYVIAADFNGDGTPDFADADYSSKDAIVFLGVQTLTSTGTSLPALYGNINNVVAAYAGDSFFSGSTSSVLSESVLVPAGPTPSITMTVVEDVAKAQSKKVQSIHVQSLGKSSLKPYLEIAERTPITIAAAVVIGGIPVAQGTVTFFDGTVALATQTVSSSGAASTITILDSGSHSLFATYNGSNAVSATTSLALTVVITPTISNVLTASGKPGTYTLTAAITGDAFAIPSGTATLVDGSNGATLGQATLTPGSVEMLPIAAPGSPISISGKPVLLAEGGFNGDQNADLAVIDSSAGTVTILIGNGTGRMTVAPGSPIALGASPVRITSADFNGDLKDDLAIATTSGKIIILLSDGAGQFHAAASSPISATGNASIVSGDFNNDGNADLAIAGNSNSGSVSILIGDGTGNFTLASGSPFEVNSPSAIAIGDFNQDGQLDLAITNASSNQISVMLGDGTGRFSSAANSPFATGANPVAAVVGDFNGDGKLDLATANQGSGSTSSANLTILLGDGRGNFSAASASPFVLSGIPMALSAGAIAGPQSGLAVANQDGTITVLQPDAAGNFSEAAGSPLSVSSSLASLVLKDFDNDGKLDFAALNTISNSLIVKLNRTVSSSTVVATNIAVTGPGLHSVTALYSGDSVYPASTSNAVTLTATTAPDFTIASATASQNIAPGQTAQYTVALSPQNGFTGTVALSCSGLPASYTCSFAPLSVTLNGAEANAVMTISSTSSASVADPPRFRPFQQSGLWLFPGLAMFLLVLASKASRTGQIQAVRMACVAITLVGMSTLQSCGNAPITPAIPPPAKTYTITITGSSGVLTHSTTVILALKGTQ